MRLAIIPARGGSKRIPRKNIKPFGGQPMLAWSIDAAQQSGCFDRIIVSTDDPEISEVAKAYGAEVPFVRPLELSDDHTGTIPVIAHAINWQNAQGNKEVSEACCIYATAPFVRAQDLKRGLEVLTLVVRTTHSLSPATHSQFSGPYESRQISGFPCSNPNTPIPALKT